MTAALPDHNSVAVPADCTVVSADIPVRLTASAVHTNPDSTVSADHILTVRDTAAARPNHNSAAVPVYYTAAADMAAVLQNHNSATDPAGCTVVSADIPVRLTASAVHMNPDSTAPADHLPTVPVHCSAYLSVPDCPLMSIYHPYGYHLHCSVHPCCHLPPM